jgi:hypothetical protein
MLRSLNREWRVYGNVDWSCEETDIAVIGLRETQIHIEGIRFHIE